MSRIEEDYEIVSDVARSWIGGILWFYAAIIGYIAVILIVVGIAAAFTYHPILSVLAVIGIIWLLSIRYTWAAVWSVIRFVLILVLALGLLMVGLILAPYLTIAVGVGLIVWAVVKGNRRRAAQAAEAAHRGEVAPTRQQQEEEGEDDGGTPRSSCEP